MKRNKANNQSVVDLSFDIVLLLKSLFALGEVLGGIFLFFITPERMSGIVGWFTRGELKEDPSDFIAHLLLNKLGASFYCEYTISRRYLSSSTWFNQACNAVTFMEKDSLGVSLIDFGFFRLYYLPNDRVFAASF